VVALKATTTSICVREELKGPLRDILAKNMRRLRAAHGLSHVEPWKLLRDD
jgi:hypothetical protein